MARRTDHLNSWKPGQSGNPNGRPPKDESERFQGLTNELRKIMKGDGYLQLQKIEVTDEKGNATGTVIEYGKVRLPNQQLLMITLANKGVKGDIRAIETIMNRLEPPTNYHQVVNVNSATDTDIMKREGERLIDIAEKNKF